MKSVKKIYIIAEAGVNHNGSMKYAARLIAGAKKAGANAIKFQTYRAETIATKYSPSYWDTNKEKIWDYLNSLLTLSDMVN